MRSRTLFTSVLFDQISYCYGNGGSEEFWQSNNEIGPDIILRSIGELEGPIRISSREMSCWIVGATTELQVSPCTQHCNHRIHPNAYARAGMAGSFLFHLSTRKKVLGTCVHSMISILPSNRPAFGCADQPRKHPEVERSMSSPFRNRF